MKKNIKTHLYFRYFLSQYGQIVNKVILHINYCSSNRIEEKIVYVYLIEELSHTLLLIRY